MEFRRPSNHFERLLNAQEGYGDGMSEYMRMRKFPESHAKFIEKQGQSPKSTGQNEEPEDFQE